jgi:hypothetical protein
MAHDKQQKQPSPSEILKMMQRMHNSAAADCSRAGWHSDSAQHDQLAAKYRNASNE